MARERIIDKDWETDLTNPIITFTARKAGRTIKEGQVATFDLTKVASSANSPVTPEEYRFFLALHGGSQKIGDSYASVAGDIDLAFDNLNETIQQMYDGIWEARGEAEGMRIGELAEAVAHIKGLGVDAVRAMLKGPDAPNGDASDEDKAAYATQKEARTKQINELRRHPRVKLVMAELKAAKLKAAMAEAGELPELNM